MRRMPWIAIWRSSIFVASSRWDTAFWKRPSRKRERRDFWDEEFSDPASISRSFCIPAPAPISAEKKRDCSNRWRASAGIRGRSRRFRQCSGLYGCPTVVNNVETLANLPHIFNRGVDWYKSIGSDEKNTGPKLYCVSGHVNKPAVVERELGIPLPELIYDVCGGIRNGNKLKGVIPGGSSVPILTADEIDVRMDFDSLAAEGNPAGFRRLHGDRRNRLHGQTGLANGAILCGRNLRTVHAMPRRNVVDGTGPASHRARPRKDVRIST